jgi:hypothetical protein
MLAQSKGSEALPILQSLPEGSSGTGISFYSQAAKCSRKLHLDKQAEASQAGNFRPDVGKIFHALCEIYFSTGHSNIAVELSDVNLGEAPDEARRLFSAYAERFSPQDFSRVVATELLLPASPEQEGLVASAVGVSPFTCRLDMVVEVDARSVDILYKKRGIIIPEPGIYLWDFKTKGQKGSNDEVVYRYSPQFIAYQIVWNTLNPGMPAKGMIADVIVGHKKLTDNSFYSVLVPPPTNEFAAGLRRWLAYAQKQASNDEPNWLACFDFGRACPHLLSGACNRT